MPPRKLHVKYHEFSFKNLANQCLGHKAQKSLASIKEQVWVNLAVQYIQLWHILVNKKTVWIKIQKWTTVLCSKDVRVLDSWNFVEMARWYTWTISKISLVVDNSDNYTESKPKLNSCDREQITQWASKKTLFLSRFVTYIWSVQKFQKSVGQNLYCVIWNLIPFSDLSGQVEINFTNK